MRIAMTPIQIDCGLFECLKEEAIDPLDKKVIRGHTLLMLRSDRKHRAGPTLLREQNGSNHAARLADSRCCSADPGPPSHAVR
jgi:hypothetical protein